MLTRGGPEQWREGHWTACPAPPPPWAGRPRLLPEPTFLHSPSCLAPPAWGWRSPAHEASLFSGHMGVAPDGLSVVFLVFYSFVCSPSSRLWGTVLGGGMVLRGEHGLRRPGTQILAPLSPLQPRATTSHSRGCFHICEMRAGGWAQAGFQAGYSPWDRKSWTGLSD